MQGFISLAAFDELRRTQDMFDEVCGYGGRGDSTMAVEVNGAIVQRPMEAVAGQCYRMLGVQPLLGRLLPERESNSGDAEPVAVIGYEFWQHEFGGDRSVIGRPLHVEGVPLTIIGVTPPGTPTVGIELTTDVTVPQGILPRVFKTPDAARVYYVIGRLRAGVTPAMAQARLNVLWPAIRKAGVSQSADPAVRYMHDLREIRVTSAANGLSRLRLRFEAPLLLLVGLAAIVLIVACVNVGGLLLARAVAREGELAVHLALGATRLGVARHLLAEGVVLAAIGACAAIPLAFWIVRSLVALIWTRSASLTMKLTPDASVVAAMGLGALVCGLIVSVPAIAFWLTRPEHAGWGKSRTVLAGTGWMGKTLVVLQLAISLALLFTAGLFLKNLEHLRAIDPGYRTSGIMWARLGELPGRAALKDPSAYARELLAQLSQLPGVTSVSLSYVFPTAPAGPQIAQPLRAEGMLAGSEINATPEHVSPDFFDLTGIGLIEGRVFTAQDDTAHPAVAILNATLARQLFPYGHALGKHIYSDRTEDAAHQAEVVGIARDASPGDIRISHAPILYRPIFQETIFLRWPVLAIRAEYPAGVGDAVRRKVASFDHHYVRRLEVLQDSIDRSLVNERTLLVLSSFIGGLGLLLASLGLYALLAYTIGRRQRELGLRMALGASSPMLVRMVIREALMLMLLAIVIGAPAALGLGRLAGSMLFGLSPFDSLTLAATTLVLLAASIGALSDPVRRVAALEPASALRAD